MRTIVGGRRGSGEEVSNSDGGGLGQGGCVAEAATVPGKVIAWKGVGGSGNAGGGCKSYFYSFINLFYLFLLLVCILLFISRLCRIMAERKLATATAEREQGRRWL